jgi:hypothetical protein
LWVRIRAATLDLTPTSISDLFAEGSTVSSHDIFSLVARWRVSPLLRSRPVIPCSNK